jgi:hypothetical protein
MPRPNLDALQCEALFASSLPQSDSLTPGQVREVIAQTISALGGHGCAARVAQEYGDYPETAVARMRWARSVIAQTHTGVEATAAS